jgi:hypothetical protein
MSDFRRSSLYDRDTFVTMAFLAAILAIPQGVFAWGREGHEIVVIVAEHYMRPETAAAMRKLLAPESPEEASVWADEYRHDHRETGPWHYIDIPLADSKIDLARECPNGDRVIAKTEQFLAVLKDPNAGKDSKAQALRFVIHFVGDLHQASQIGIHQHEGLGLSKFGDAEQRLVGAPPAGQSVVGIRKVVHRLKRVTYREDHR